MTPPLWQRAKKSWRASWWKWKRRVEKAGLKLNIQNTKIMASSPITSWQIDGETVEIVRDFILGGSKITADGYCSHEIKRCLLLGRKAMSNLDSMLKSWDITLPTSTSREGILYVWKWGEESVQNAVRRTSKKSTFELWKEEELIGSKGPFLRKWCSYLTTRNNEHISLSKDWYLVSHESMLSCFSRAWLFATLWTVMNTKYW